MNSVHLIGRLVRDPELRYGAGSQTAVCKFTVAIDRGKDRDGNDMGADFPRVTVFGRQAENCDRYLAKGRMVAVQGRIQTGSYQNKDGATVYTTDVVADRVEFIDWGDKSQRSEGGNRTQGGYNGGYSGGNQGGNSRPSQFDSNDSQDDAPEGFSKLDEDIPF